MTLVLGKGVDKSGRNGGTAMRSRVVLVGLTVSAADTRVNCGGLSAILCYNDGIGAPFVPHFIDTSPIERTRARRRLPARPSSSSPARWRTCFEAGRRGAMCRRR